MPNNCPSVINTNNVTETKNNKQKWSRGEYREVIESYYTATFFPSRKSNTIETYEIWRENNPTARPNMDANKFATMRRTIIKNKYLSEMEIDEIKLKVQSNCEYQLPNVEANNNSFHSDQHHISQPNGDVESQNTPSLQTHVSAEQISNKVQNGLSPEVLNIDPQSQPELDKINELKERALIEWMKVQNVEISECNPLSKIRNTNMNQSTISKTNIAVKNIIDKQEPDLTSLNHLIYASAVIGTESCNVKIEAPKRNVPRNLAWQERIQKQISTLRSDLETLKNVQNNNNVKISKSRKPRAKYKIKRPDKIQNV